MKYFKGLIILLTITGCTSSEHRFYYNLKHYENFNIVDQDLFRMNVRDCRSQPHCRAEDLFDRW